MTAKEYRDKEAITDANFWNGDEIDFDAICEFAEDYHEAKLKLLNIPVVMGSVSDELLLKAWKYEDEANADFDTDGIQHNLNIGRYDGLMMAVQEINKHLP